MSDDTTAPTQNEGFSHNTPILKKSGGRKDNDHTQVASSNAEHIISNLSTTKKDPLHRGRAASLCLHIHG
jgi:hypothetical protein